MTHTLTAIRILSSLASVWAYVAFKMKVTKENERRAMRQRVEDVIRGSQCI